jgi:hypothetical protein
MITTSKNDHGVLCLSLLECFRVILDHNSLFYKAMIKQVMYVHSEYSFLFHTGVPGTYPASWNFQLEYTGTLK